jgi:hypothetical protein
MPIRILGLTDSRVARITTNVGGLAAEVQGTTSAAPSFSGRVISTLGVLDGTLIGQFGVPNNRNGLIASTLGVLDAFLLSKSAEDLLTVGDHTVVEGSIVSVQLIRGSDGYPVVAYSYTTVAGTAVAGTDYTAISGTDTISQGQTKTYNIQTTNDAIAESSEAFKLRFSNIRFI